MAEEIILTASDDEEIMLESRDYISKTSGYLRMTMNKIITYVFCSSREYVCVFGELNKKVFFFLNIFD